MNSVPRGGLPIIILCILSVLFLGKLFGALVLSSKKSTFLTNYQSHSLDSEFSFEESKLRYVGRLSRQKSSSKPEFSISVITAANTKLRFSSLVRLYDSLVKADYLGYTNVKLIFNIDAGASADVIEYANEIIWPHGPKEIRHRVKRGGLVTAVAESWYPSSPEDHCIILEDDIEVSPYYFVWLVNLLDAHYADPDPRVVGLSLYTPRTVEHIAGKARFNVDTSKTFKYEKVYGQPLPCSWGALWFPNAWMDFLAYMSTRLEIERHAGVDDTVVSVPFSHTMHWAKSWKKYMAELMYSRDYYMIYPNFPNQLSLSTNHVELGEHVGSEEDRLGRLSDFEVPLFEGTSFEKLENEFGIEKPLEAPASLREIKMLDFYARPMIDLECLKDDKCLTKFPPTIPPTSFSTRLWSKRRYILCEKVPFNDNYLTIDSSRLTLVIDGGKRCNMETLVKQLEYYSQSSEIAAILVVWNDTDRDPPPSIRVSDKTVTFLPQFSSSRNNRFNPSSKIVSEGVIITEVGVRVHLDDIKRAAILWFDGRQKYVVGFSGLSVGGNSGAYLGIRSNFMLLHSRFLKMYTCNEAMEYIHEQVDSLGGCQDVAMSLLISAKNKVPSALIVRPTKPLMRFASVDSQQAPSVNSAKYKQCLLTFSNHLLGSYPPPSQLHLAEVNLGGASDTSPSVDIVEVQQQRWRQEVAASPHTHHAGLDMHCLYEKAAKKWIVQEGWLLKYSPYMGRLSPSSDPSSLCDTAWDVPRESR